MAQAIILLEFIKNHFNLKKNTQLLKNTTIESITNLNIQLQQVTL